jgi:hypothetical protein
MTARAMQIPIAWLRDVGAPDATDSHRRREPMDERGRSLAADRRRKAKRMAKPGYGDQGDRAA